MYKELNSMGSVGILRREDIKEVLGEVKEVK